jgi:hypothetical protein
MGVTVGVTVAVGLNVTVGVNVIAGDGDIVMVGTGVLVIVIDGVLVGVTVITGEQGPILDTFIGVKLLGVDCPVQADSSFIVLQIVILGQTPAIGVPTGLVS